MKSNSGCHRPEPPEHVNHTFQGNKQLVIPGDKWEIAIITLVNAKV